MKLSALFIIFHILPLSFINPTADISKIIRIKIENSSLQSLEAFDEKIHCAVTLPEFYRQRFFEPAWEENTAKQLVEAISKASEEGLKTSDYHFQKLSQIKQNALQTGLSTAEYDLLLTDAFLLYASHLISGKVDPTTIDAEWLVTRREDDPVKILITALKTKNIKKALREILPEHSTYKGLKQALARYLNLKQAEWKEIPEGTTMKIGMTDARIPEIRNRLLITTDLNNYEYANPEIYDEHLFNTVKQFQKRHGLDDDGEIGTKTIQALNIPIQQRINQIRVNLERWRWLPKEFGDYYIKVNIANFELEVFKNRKLEREHKIIVGKPFRRTPVFSARMQYLVLNPTWTIPPGILNNDILPAVRKDQLYLAKKNISVLDQNGNTLDPLSIDWKSSAAKGYTYRQAPGPDNSLGAVKFMFPNPHHVYLHDTPAKELFNKTERAFSSGCIRVKDPLDLAEYIINDPVNWNKEKIEKTVSTQKTQTVPLVERPVVYLLYWTAWTDANGIIQFRKDIYERDEAVLKELGQDAPLLTY